MAADSVVACGMCTYPSLEKLTAELDGRNLGSEAGEGLCELGADRAATHDRQPPRLFGEVENVVVGQKTGLFQTGDCWNSGA